MIHRSQRDDVPAAEVEAALDMLRTPYTVRYTSSAELRSRAPMNCATDRADPLVQWRGIALAYEMLLEHEHTRNQSFRWVARLRPDICYTVPPNGALAALKNDLLSVDTTGCMNDDVYALLPRWAAAVYASTADTIADCALRPRSCAHKPPLERALRNSLNTHMPSSAHFLRHGMVLRYCSSARKSKTGMNTIIRAGVPAGLITCRKSIANSQTAMGLAN